jgi:hypothetical protein
MSKHDTPITTLQRIIRNTNTKNTLTKTKILESNEYNNLLLFIINNTTINNTLNYTEQIYNTKYNTKARIKYYVTDNKGNIINISHVIFLLYKRYMPIIKLNVKHNYIIGDLHTSAEIYARLSNYIYSINKQQIRIHQITPFI